MLMRVLKEFCFLKNGTAAARPIAAQDLRESVRQGYELYRAGKRAAAERVFREILECDPRHVDALCLLAEIHLESGREKEAIQNYQTALRYRPDIVVAWLNLARLHARRRSVADLVRCLIRLEEIGGHDADVWNDLGVLWLDAGNWDRAAASFRAALAQDAGHARALCNLGLFAQNQGQLTSALALLERAVAIAPACAEAQNNYGLLLRDLGRPREALQPLARAIAEKPDFAQAHANYAVVCQDLGRFEEAAEAFDRALALAPESGDLHLAKAHFLLSLGRFREGWEEHEHRLRLPGSPRERFPFPEWDGRTLGSEETLLVCAEQGIGDEIMFASCIPDLRGLAERVIVECDPRLEGLFHRSFPGIRFVGKRFQPAGSWLRDLPSIHRQVALGSLPRFFRNAWDDFPRHGGYLIPDVDRMRRWQERLDRLGPGLKIGLSWQGGTSRTDRYRRSLPLESLRTVLEIPGVRCVSLQYTDCREELARMRADFGIDLPHWQEAIEDYEETAALVASLDLVITVCTAVVHLAGALGTPVWVLVPCAPSWRYLRHGTVLPWYPSARLFRQQEPLCWEPVLEAIKRELARQRGVIRQAALKAEGREGACPW